MKIIDPKKYKTIIFDCDGVILDSNNIKTEAFYSSVLHYGKDLATKFKLYHEENGGISRYKKYEYFFSDILKKPLEKLSYDRAIAYFYDAIIRDLLTCPVNSYLNEFKLITPSSKWVVVSGGDQSELRYVFKKRGISKFFDLGIFGSPSSKEEILSQLKKDNYLNEPVLFLGDSKYDYEAARAFDIDFLFISCWTEFRAWKDYQKKYKFAYIEDLGKLVLKS